MITATNKTRKREVKIVVVDDDPEILRSLKEDLEDPSVRVFAASDGESGLDLIHNEKPDLVILDVSLPFISGLEICDFLRKDNYFSRIPIVMLSSRDMGIDRINGLETGADDYVTKPYNPRELKLRIKRIFWRVFGDETDDLIVLGELSVNLASHKVAVAGSSIDLTPTEYRLLCELLDKPGRVKSRDLLLSKVWNHSDDLFSRTVDTHIQRLRNKLKSAGQFIETVRGTGYRFNTDGMDLS